MLALFSLTLAFYNSKLAKENPLGTKGALIRTLRVRQSLRDSACSAGSGEGFTFLKKVKSKTKGADSLRPPIALPSKSLRDPLSYEFRSAQSCLALE